jgi:NAD(P)H dehydrogenase (quinone)
MILITGASGHFGKAAINSLLEKGVEPNNISALVRDESKVTGLKAKGVIIKTGDYNDKNSLAEAFKNTDKVLFVSGSDPVSRDKQHENIVKAAKEAGVNHIIYTSIERQNETAASPIAMISLTHLETERQIKESGIPYTILRNNLYTDMLPIYLGEKVLEQGVFFPAGEGKAAFALRNEMAEAAANILTGSGHTNKDYHISNTENVSFADIARALSDITGKNIAYHSPDAATFTSTLLNAGVPKEYVEIFAAFGEGIREGELAAAETDLEKLLGRRPASYKKYLEEVYGHK